MWERGDPDQQIKITDRLPRGSQPSSLFAEPLGGFLVHSNYRDTAQKIVQLFLTSLWVGRIVNTLLELGKRDD